MQGNHTVIVFEPGDQIEALASKEGVRFIFVSARPLKEPVAWYGPIVMNTEDELRTAFDELNKGTFYQRAWQRQPPHRRRGSDGIQNRLVTNSRFNFDINLIQ